MNDPIWSSYVWFEGKCFNISTINRVYSTYEGESSGPETAVFEFDEKTRARGKMLFLGGGGFNTHVKLAQELMTRGETLEE